MATTPAKKATAPARTASPASKSAAKAPAPSTRPAPKKQGAPRKDAVKKAPAKLVAKASASTKAAPSKATSRKAAPTKATAAKATPTKATAARATPTKATPSRSSAKKAPAKKAAPAGKTARKEAGVKSSHSFDKSFLESQRVLLIDERANLVGQAQRLEDEAAELMEDLDPGDVQFDDESGEGDSLVVERERDLALSAQARQTVIDIDAALARIKNGSYGYSVVSGRPIPKERLKAIPWATELVEEKVGGLGSRR